MTKRAVAKAKPRNSTIFAIASDPVGQGLVASLAQPGGNITGLSLEATDVGSKRLELLRQVVPQLRHLAIMFNADYPAAMLENGATQAASHILGIDATPYGIRQADDIAPPLTRSRAVQTRFTLLMMHSGHESQSIFDVLTRPCTGTMDEARIIELTKNVDEECRLAHRHIGYERAHNLIKEHMIKVEQIAKNLLAKGSLTQAEVCSLLEI
jgi:ABC transporter substrate binding protein